MAFEVLLAQMSGEVDVRKAKLHEDGTQEENGGHQSIQNEIVDQGG